MAAFSSPASAAPAGEQVQTVHSQSRMLGFDWHIKINDHALCSFWWLFLKSLGLALDIVYIIYREQDSSFCAFEPQIWYQVIENNAHSLSTPPAPGKSYVYLLVCCNTVYSSQHMGHTNGFLC